MSLMEPLSPLLQPVCSASRPIGSTPEHDPMAISTDRNPRDWLASDGNWHPAEATHPLSAPWARSAPANHHPEEELLQGLDHLRGSGRGGRVDRCNRVRRD